MGHLAEDIVLVGQCQVQCSSHGYFVFVTGSYIGSSISKWCTTCSSVVFVAAVLIDGSSICHDSSGR